MQILKKSVCLQTLSQKDGEALQKLSKFDTGVTIVCRFTVNHVLSCLLRKRRFLDQTKIVLLLSTSMAGSALMAGTLRHKLYSILELFTGLEKAQALIQA